MGDRGRIALAAGAALLLAAGVAYWFYRNFEAHQREVRLELSAQARRNPLLAAERFLRRIGREVESVSGRDRLLHPPPPGDVLLVKRFGANLPPEREQALADWVGDGGHLIVTPEEAWDEVHEGSGNRFLDRFDVHLQLGDDAPEDGEEAGPVQVVLRSGAVMRVAFDRRRRLEDLGADPGEAGETGLHLLQYQVGAGRLTVLSDNRFLRNDRIGDADHALFLASLVEEGGKVWLLYSSAMPSLAVLLWRSQPHLVVSGLLLVLLWLRRLAGFTGPRRDTGTAPARRNLLEHLEAAAAFDWREERGRRLLARAREALGREWLRRHHRLAQMGRHERCGWIAGHSGVPRRVVEEALYGAAGSERDFIRISAAQQRLAAAMNRRKERE